MVLALGYKIQYECLLFLQQYLPYWCFKFLKTEYNRTVIDIYFTMYYNKFNWHLFYYVLQCITINLMENGVYISHHRSRYTSWAESVAWMRQVREANTKPRSLTKGNARWRYPGICQAAKARRQSSLLWYRRFFSCCSLGSLSSDGTFSSSSQSSMQPGREPGSP